MSLTISGFFETARKCAINIYSRLRAAGPRQYRNKRILTPYNEGENFMNVHRYRILLCAACCFALGACCGLARQGCRARQSTITTVDELHEDRPMTPHTPLTAAYELGGDIDAIGHKLMEQRGGFIPICQ